MVQFDIISFFVQVFWVLVFIYIYYFFLLKNVVVNIAQVLKIRNKIVLKFKNLKTGNTTLHDFILLKLINKVA